MDQSSFIYCYLNVTSHNSNSNSIIRGLQTKDFFGCFDQKIISSLKPLFSFGSCKQQGFSHGRWTLGGKS